MNVYLIAAESYHLINNEITKIVKNNKYLTMNLNKISLSEILEEISYVSLTPEQKIIVASNANFFSTNKVNEQDSKLLLNYLNSPDPNTTIIFTTLNPIDARKKQVKIIKEKYKLINILPYKYKDKEILINEYVKKNGYKIEKDAINYIINNTNSVDMIFNELDKIFLYYNHPEQITNKDIINIVGSIIDNNNFHFVDAVINKNLKEALKLFRNLKIYKVEPITLIILLAREYRLIYFLKRLQKKQKSMAVICQNLGLQDWQVNKLYNESLGYTEDEVLFIIKNLANIDIGIKKGFLEKEASVIAFLVDVCA